MAKIFAAAGACAVALLLTAPAAFALKYAPVEHHLKVDPAIPQWKPSPVASVPEEEVSLVGADVMDEITLGWIKLYRRQYPRLSVTMEAKASGAGAPGLISGKADLAPVGREMLPAERAAFVAKFGYQPFEIRVATGSVGSLGKTATTVILVDKDNPIKGLTMAQLDAIYSATRKRGHADITTWGDLGLTGAWKARPIHLYGLKPPNGIEQFFQTRVMLDGAFKKDIEFVKGRGFTHAFTVAAEDMATHPGGLTYALLANVTPNVKVVPLAQDEGGPFYLPTVENVYSHTYPLSRFVYIYVNRPPGKPLEPKVREFLKLVLSREGQDVVAHEGVYIPLTPEIVKEELQKLDAFGLASTIATSATAALAADKNWTPPKAKIYAQALSDQTMAQHPELLSVTFHGVPPNTSKVYTMFAGSFPDRIGNPDDPDDIDVQTKGITIVDPRWHRTNDPQKKFVVLLPLRDAKSENIGLIVYAFKNPNPTASDERKFYTAALEMRDALQSKIPSYAALFEPAK